MGGSDPVTDTLDSDADPETGTTPATGFLPANTADMSLDMGIYAKVGVGDRVWFDDNFNGIQDAEEAGVPNIEVSLFNAARQAWGP